MNPNAVVLDHHDPTTGRRWTTKHRGPAARPTEAEDWTLVDQANADPAPIPAEHARAVRLAIVACAEAHDGLVHASWVRELMPTWVRDKTRGGVTSGLVSSGILVAHGRPRRSHDRKNRNDKRWLSTYRVADWDRLKAEAKK